MQRLLAVVVAVLVLVAGSACDSSDAQEDFEDAAFTGPFEGVTETDADGEVVGSVDDDDWRISPRYDNAVQISRPAYPNPTEGRPVTIEINVLFDDAVIGDLALYSINDNGRLRRRDVIPESGHAGFYTFVASPALLGQTTGIVRVFIFDETPGDLRIVSYGDVLLQ